MSRRTEPMITSVPAFIKPTAVLLGARHFDDMLEELDPEFRRSLKVSGKEHRRGKSVTLRDYLKARVARRAG